MSLPFRHSNVHDVCVRNSQLIVSKQDEIFSLFCKKLHVSYRLKKHFHVNIQLICLQRWHVMYERIPE